MDRLFPARPPTASLPALLHFASAVLAGEVLIREVYAGDVTAIHADRYIGWARLASAGDWEEGTVHPITAVEVTLGWRSEEPEAVELERLGWFIAAAPSFRPPLARAVARRLVFLAHGSQGSAMVTIRTRVLRGAAEVPQALDERAAIEQLLIRSVRATMGELARARVDDTPVSRLCIHAQAADAGVALGEKVGGGGGATAAGLRRRLTKQQTAARLTGAPDSACSCDGTPDAISSVAPSTPPAHQPSGSGGSRVVSLTAGGGRGTRGRMPLGPSARRWVRFFQSGLDLSHNSALAQELVERVEAVHTLDDTVLTARAAFTPRGQGPVAVGGHSALLGPQQIWCGTCSPLNDKVRFLSGQIDFSVPCAYLPSDPGSSAFNFMWSRVAMDDTSRHLDWATIERIINTTSWGGGATLGDYPGWSGASGRNRIFLEWVLQIIYSYRSFMPREWPSQAVMRAYTGQSAGSALGMSAAPLLGGVHSAYNPSASSPLLVAGAGGGVSGRHYCRDAESAVGDLMENEAAFLVVWAPGADLCPLDGADQLQEHVDATTCERSYDLWEGLPYGMTVPYRGQNGSAGVQVCSSWIAGPARTADHFLHWGNRAYWTAISGQSEDLKDCLELLNASRLCGRVALGATMIPARTLMHEFIHRALSGDHCSTACCPQGLAVIFWAATRAYLGVPSVIVGTPGQVDTDFLDDSDFYSSQCHQANNESFAITFTWDDVGSSGKSNAYSISNVTWAPSCLP